ncbi:ABC transporter permease [Nocardiopsis sp. FIRDI 009]|uniref:ABC transporter permease n=1 Tax=Nocardiopsis sp. FIRDI 009 TaxID=714197 RepID=UPI000E24D8E6|nr:ABC-2 family transporter protein [Nocardiopsis sp. FIRDI 009]
MAEPLRTRAPWPLRIYVRLAWTWCRALAQYPASLVLLTVFVSLGALAEMGAVVIVFGHAGELAGFGVAEGLLVYGLSATAFGCADMLMGSVERLGQHIRTGAFDTMLIRPVPPLVLLATDQFTPRRLGKIVPAAAVLVLALVRCDIDWTPARALMLPVLLVSSIALCCAVWTASACIQFVATDARQAANSLTYGGQALTEYPLAVYGREVVRSATFVLPLAFVSWQPALFLLGRPDPTGLPDALRLAPPVAALLMCAVAALCWRAGLRRYRSTGS